MLSLNHLDILVNSVFSIQYETLSGGRRFMWRSARGSYSGRVMLRSVRESLSSYIYIW